MACCKVGLEPPSDPDCFRCESVSFGEGLQTTAVNIFKPLRPLASLS